LVTFPQKVIWPRNFFLLFSVFFHENKKNPDCIPVLVPISTHPTVEPLRFWLYDFYSIAEFSPWLWVHNVQVLHSDRRISFEAEATSLEWKIPVFGKSECSAKFFLREIWVDYVQNFCKKIVYGCLNVP
jgi:hypothetical protein